MFSKLYSPLYFFFQSIKEGEITTSGLVAQTINVRQKHQNLRPMDGEDEKRA